MNRLFFAYRNWIFSHPTANATYAQAHVEQSQRKFPGADFRAPPEAAIVPHAVPAPPLLDRHGPSAAGAYRQAPSSTPSRYQQDRHPKAGRTIRFKQRDSVNVIEESRELNKRPETKVVSSGSSSSSSDSHASSVKE